MRPGGNCKHLPETPVHEPEVSYTAQPPAAEADDCILFIVSIVHVIAKQLMSVQVPL